MIPLSDDKQGLNQLLPEATGTCGHFANRGLFKVTLFWTFWSKKRLSSLDISQ